MHIYIELRFIIFWSVIKNFKVNVCKIVIQMVKKDRLVPIQGTLTVGMSNKLGKTPNKESLSRRACLSSLWKLRWRAFSKG